MLLFARGRRSAFLCSVPRFFLVFSIGRIARLAFYLEMALGLWSSRPVILQGFWPQSCTQTANKKASCMHAVGSPMARYTETLFCAWMVRLYLNSLLMRYLVRLSQFASKPMFCLMRSIG